MINKLITLDGVMQGLLRACIEQGIFDPETTARLKHRLEKLRPSDPVRVTPRVYALLQAEQLNRQPPELMMLKETASGALLQVYLSTDSGWAQARADMQAQDLACQIEDEEGLVLARQSGPRHLSLVQVRGSKVH